MILKNEVKGFAARIFSSLSRTAARHALKCMHA